MSQTLNHSIHTGNVIRAPDGDLWIVTDVHDREDHSGTIEAVSFDAENCSAVMRLDDHERNETCGCGDHPDFMGDPQEDCEDCHGTGRYTKQIRGWRHSTVLASNVKAFILDGFKKAMRL